MKAAFLYNFVKFVDWPSDTFHRPEDPLLFCVVGSDPLREDLQRLIAGKMVNNHSLKVEQIDQPSGLHACHLAFISGEQSQSREYLALTRRLPVLTVGESRQFGSWGGIITFVMEGDQVRFEVNLESADRAGLKISSKLLALARAINVGKGEP